MGPIPDVVRVLRRYERIHAMGMITIHCTYPDGESSEARYALTLDVAVDLYCSSWELRSDLRHSPYMPLAEVAACLAGES